MSQINFSAFLDCKFSSDQTQKYCTTKPSPPSYHLHGQKISAYTVSLLQYYFPIWSKSDDKWSTIKPKRIRKRSKRLISPMFAMQDFALPEVSTSKRMYLHILVRMILGIQILIQALPWYALKIHQIGQNIWEIVKNIFV